MGISIRKAGPGIYEVEARPDARVPARFVASDELLPSIRRDTKSLEQLRNVATLPGAVGAAWAMPDMHMGYGFPIGGVAATDATDGVVSPGGVGYDINCGVRLVALDLTRGEIAPRLERIADVLFDRVPCGVGRGGDVDAGPAVLRNVLTEGGRWAADHGYGTHDDLAFVEEGSRIAGADPSRVSDQALARGRKQLGTLGSGNHFLELGTVEEIRDPEAAEAFGLRMGQVTVLLHSGSRGLGHQVCTDFLKTMRQAMKRYDIRVPDPQLCCVPVRSAEGQAYLGAMNAAVNFAFANRQILAHRAVTGIAEALDVDPASLGARTVYEVAHNIAKLETHTVDGVPRTVCVHRKGATRAFPAGSADLPDRYRETGQPVLIPGDMERYSYVLAGLPGSMERAFGSSCHGAGRALSRTRARERSRHRPIAREMAERGILVRSASRRTQQEEVAEAYKDVAEVVEAVAQAGLSTVVARLRPLAVVKG
jgi:tRNA-splicing ligase RtcB